MNNFKIKVCGITNEFNLNQLTKYCFDYYGFNGFLIGENFMKTNDPSYACLNFIKSLYE